MFRLVSGGLNGSMTEDDLTLIAGGTGRTGRRVADRLHGSGSRLRIVAGGVPRPEAEALAALFGEILDGRGSSLTADIQQVLGRPAGDFAGYARRAASTGVWNEAGVWNESVVAP
jgi:NAD(P)-dependent dehydrogenase (short-subunit alcohol dehydrogenase family)